MLYYIISFRQNNAVLSQKFVFLSQVLMGDLILWKLCNIDEFIKIESFCTFFEKEVESDFIFNGESHDFWECLYVIDGCLAVTGGSKVYHMCEGDIIFHKPMEFHKYRNIQNSAVKILVFSFTMSGEYCEFFSEKVMHLTARQQGVVDEIIKYAYHRPNNFLGDSLKWYNQIDILADSPIYLFALKVQIERLFVSLYENCDELLTYQSEHAMLFNRAVTYMNKNICEPLGVSDIAKALNISSSGLQRIFTKYVGISVHRYFIKLKINLATELIRQGKQISFISDYLGFSGLPYFSKLYKRETGVSPSAHRKKK